VDRALTILTYVALLLLGLAVGLLGAFFYSSGPAPLVSVAFDLAILAACLLGAWGTRKVIGGLAPAVGWFAVIFVLAKGTASGSIMITATSAGEWFLFGGSVGAAFGLVAGLATWTRPPRATRS
jgi:hypothetical protein